MSTSPAEVNYVVPVPDLADTATSAADLLRLVRHYLSDEGAWKQGAWATTKIGSIVPPVHPQAACWCASGALSRASHDIAVHNPKASSPAVRQRRFSVARQALIRVINRERPHDLFLSWTIMDWNDDDATTHAAVLAVIDTAIEELE